MIRRLTLGVLVLFVAGCGEGREPEPPPASVSIAPETVATPLPVDRSGDAVLGEIEAWAARDSIPGDLNGDGTEETVVLTAAASVDAQGRPMWDDGQRWAVLVRTPGGEDVIYEQFVQLGRADVTLLDHDGNTQLLITESGPTGRRIWQVRWDGPGDAEVVAQAGGVTLGPDSQLSLP